MADGFCGESAVKADFNPAKTMMPKQRHHGCRIRECIRLGHAPVTLEDDLVRISVLLSKGADIVEFRHKPPDVDGLWHLAGGIPAISNCAPETANGCDVLSDFYGGAWNESFPGGNCFGASKEHLDLFLLDPDFVDRYAAAWIGKTLPCRDVEFNAMPGADNNLAIMPPFALPAGLLICDDRSADRAQA